MRVEAGEAEVTRAGHPDVPAGGVVARGHDALRRPASAALPSALPAAFEAALGAPAGDFGHLVVLALDVHDVHVVADVEAFLADALVGLHVAVLRVGVRHVEPLRPEVSRAGLGRRRLRGGGGHDLRGKSCAQRRLRVSNQRQVAVCKLFWFSVLPSRSC